MAIASLSLPPSMPSIGVPPSQVITALMSGVVDIQRRVEIYEADGVTPFNVTDWDARLIDGNVTVDGTRDERRMCDFNLQNNDFALGLNPNGGFWYDKILKAFWGINYYDAAGVFTHWETQIGEFMIDRIVEDYFPNTCKVTGRDYAKKCVITKIKESLQFSNQTPVEVMVKAMAANAGITKFRLPFTGLAFQNDVVFESGTARWEMMKKITDSIGYEIYFTSDGYLTMRPYQDPVLSPLVWTFTTGPDNGSLVTYSRETNDSLLKNHIIVIGATVTSANGVSTTSYGEARNDDPASPTRILRIGDRVDTLKLDYITDAGQAQMVAETRLRVSSLEEYSINFGSMILPWIDSNDIVDIVNPKETLYVPARFLLSNFTLPMSLGPMTGTGRRVTIVGTTRKLGVF